MRLKAKSLLESKRDVRANIFICLILKNVLKKKNCKGTYLFTNLYRLEFVNFDFQVGYNKISCVFPHQFEVHFKKRSAKRERTRDYGMV